LLAGNDISNNNDLWWIVFIGRRVSAKVVSNKDVANMREMAGLHCIRRVPPNSSAIE